SAAEVVRHLGCVQSQLHDMALWSLARRLPGATLAGLQASFDDGEFLRTHVLRPTWHFVDIADVHWLQALTGPRVRRLVETTNRSIGLTTDVVDRAVAVVVEALADGRPRTRAELAAAVEEAGLPLPGQAMAHVLISAETDALIVNGPMRGKQHTYRLLPPGPALPTRDEMLADIARRYARGHGPFRDKDLAWWTSLTLTDSRRAIDLGQLRPVDEGCWTADEPVDADIPLVMLLPNYDEYISYARDPDDFTAFGGAATDILRGTGLLMVHGRLAGLWGRTITARRVTVEIAAAPRLTAPLRRALDDEAAAYGRFLERDAEVRLVG
ncbi:MAG: winged helix DNA-binding domain-containing protein, partial [Aeromicrobium sp.]